MRLRQMEQVGRAGGIYVDIKNIVKLEGVIKEQCEGKSDELDNNTALTITIHSQQNIFNYRHVFDNSNSHSFQPITKLLITHTSMDETDYQMFKIVVIGSSGIGKSNIALRFVKGEFKDGAKSTIGVEFMYKILTVNQTKVKVTLWDTAGQEVYRALSKVYYKGALGVILVYDVTSQKSYLDVEEWYKLAKDNLNEKDIVMIVLGNKIDLVEQKVVPFERAVADYKEKLGIECFEVSARTGEGIQQSIMYLIEQIYTKNIEPQTIEPVLPPEEQEKSGLEKSEFPGNNMRATNIRGSVRPKIQVMSKIDEDEFGLERSSIVIKDKEFKGPKLDKKKKCAC